MAKRQQIFTSNFLSKTATNRNIGMMGTDVHKRYRQQRTMALEDSAEVNGILKRVWRFVEAVDKLAKNPMETIPEEDEFGATESQRQPTVKELCQVKEAVMRMQGYKRLQDTDKIQQSFRSRLTEILDTYDAFICTPPGKHPRPRWVKISRMDEEVTEHVAHLQQQLTADVAQLRDFLRGQLFDEYCLMRDTCREKKDETWLRYGECVVLQEGKCDESLRKGTAENLDLGGPEVKERLARMIDASELDPDWVLDHIEEYYIGNGHIGTWQRYVQRCRWEKLAAKLTNDIQQLEKINRSRHNGRRCNVMFNIQNTKQQFFKRLNGAQDFELSERASRMQEEKGRSL